jgi:hypothetical protein
MPSVHAGVQQHGVDILINYFIVSVNISMRLSFHPETGQSEDSNQSLEQYLRAHVNHLREDWINWLPMAEFAMNNHKSETMGVTPFYATSGQYVGFQLVNSWVWKRRISLQAE